MNKQRVRAVATAITGSTIAGGGLLLAFIAWRYLTEYPSHTLISFVTAIVSVGFALLISRLLLRRSSPYGSVCAASICLGLCVAVLGSMLWGKVAHSRFGLTVYGAIPIPVLDITVDSSGLLWFRDKSHRITLSEVRPLIDESTEVIIIGIGWHRVAKVDDAVLETLGPRVRILETSKAFEAYNKLRAEGKRVVLLAHTTC